MFLIFIISLLFVQVDLRSEYLIHVNRCNHVVQQLEQRLVFLFSDFEKLIEKPELIRKAIDDAKTVNPRLYQNASVSKRLVDRFIGKFLVLENAYHLKGKILALKNNAELAKIFDISSNSLPGRLELLKKDDEIGIPYAVFAYRTEQLIKQAKEKMSQAAQKQQEFKRFESYYLDLLRQQEENPQINKMPSIYWFSVTFNVNPSTIYKWKKEVELKRIPKKV